MNSVHVKNIQSILIADGVALNTVIKSSQPEKRSWAYPYMVELRKRAFLSMEYKFRNDYRCKKLATFGTVSRILTLVSLNSHIKTRSIHLPRRSKAIFTPYEIVRVSNDLLGTHHKTLSDLYNAKIIDERTFRHLKHKTYLLNEDIYAMMYHLISYVASEC